MKKLLLMGLLSLPLLSLAGCETLVDSPAENANAVIRARLIPMASRSRMTPSGFCFWIVQGTG